MPVIKNYFFALLSLLTLLQPAHASTPIEDKEKGIILYNQYKTNLALPFLKNAANSGDAEAQYFLGQALRNIHQYITTEAQNAYEASALQGNIYSMIRLAGLKEDNCIHLGSCPTNIKSPAEWRKAALNAAKAGAASGNAETMYLLFRLTGDDTWLKKSAENGYAFAQYFLGTGYRDGNGFFALPSSRADKVESLMKASAEGGYPPGMMAYVEVLATKNDFEAARYWYVKAAEAGYAHAVFGYGSSLSENQSELGFPYEPVKAYALISTLLELDGGGGLIRFSKEILAELAPTLTTNQLEQAAKLSKEWKNSHPPLSFFPDKL
ncbi:tetratricopeptide repeat protein [Pseudomonas sp. TMB3-21]